MSTLSPNMLIPYPMLFVSFYSSTTGTTTGAGTTNPYGASEFIPVAHIFGFQCCVFCFVCLYSVSCSHCCQCLWIVHIRFLLRFSLTFIQWDSRFSIFRFYVMFCRSLFVLLPFLFWPLYCLSFLDLWLLFTLLVSSNVLTEKLYLELN